MSSVRAAFAASCLLLLLCSTVVRTQEESSWFRISGSASVSAEYYWMNSSTDTLGVPVWSPRRPANLYRFMFTPTITLFDNVTIPITLILTSTETNTITPATLSPTLAQFFTNPLNAFSVSFKPGVDWAELQFGSHVPRYSELVGSDVQIFGGGFNAQPGPFRLAFNTGVIQRAVASDTSRSITGAYSRSLYMAKFGVGDGNKWFVDFNIMTMRDDTVDLASGPRPLERGIIRTVGQMDTTTGFTPYTEVDAWKSLLAQEGAILSLAFRVEVDDGIALVGEAAANAITRDITSSELDGGAKLVPGWLITPRSSTRADGALMGGVLVNYSDWGLDTKIKYVGPGYIPFGIPFMMSDYLDITTSPRLYFNDRKISLSGTVGTRLFNFSSQTDETLSQVIVLANASWIFSDVFSVSGSFSNFGMRNGVVNDTLRVQNVSRSISLSPMYMIPTTKIMHTISLNLSLDTYEDFNVVSGRLADNNTFGLYTMYNTSWTIMPLTAWTAINYLKNSLPVYGFSMIGFTVGSSYGFMQNKLTPSLAVTIGSNSLGDNSADTQIMFRVGLRWMIMDRLSLNVSGITNTYAYGSSKPNASFGENTFQMMLTQSF